MLQRRYALLLASCTASFCLGCLLSLTLFDWRQQQQCDCPASDDGAPPTPYFDSSNLALRMRRLPPLSGRPTPHRRGLRVFCWILTSPENHADKAAHLKATWVPRCDGYEFMSSAADASLPAVALPVPEGRSHLWLKTVAALRRIHRHHLADFDFFLKTDDDTYVVVENLRRLLASADPDAPLYAGRRFRPYLRQGYMSGGAGYVLSRAAVRRFVELALPSGDPACSDRYGSEDVNLGSCLQLVGVQVLDSLDSHGRERFHPFHPEVHLVAGGVPKTNWLWRYSYYPLREGPECCSDTSVSFHYVSPEQQYVLDYLIYRLKPYADPPAPRIGHCNDSSRRAGSDSDPAAAAAAAAAGAVATPTTAAATAGANDANGRRHASLRKP